MKINEGSLSSVRFCFVGRHQELELLHRHASGGWRWQWLHIYGQSGIGKTTLLQRFTADREGREFYYVDASRGIHQKEDVLDYLTEQLRQAGETDLHDTDSDGIVRRMNRRAQLSGNRIVLLIDAIDYWRSLETWFLAWLDALDPSVRIVTAGRNSLTGGWLRSGWAGLLHTIELQALNPVEVERYAQERGITNRDEHSQLYRFSRGVPLAMVLAAETMLRGVNDRRFDREEQYQLISVFMLELLQELPASVYRLLEAAAVYWRFNEERLAAIMEEEIESVSFRKLIGMPFVTFKQDGWMLHDAIKAWALEDFMLRKPSTYELMRRKALKQIRMEERLNPQIRPKLQLEKMSLHEHPIVRSICFSGHLDDVELRPCKESDLTALQDLYLRFHRFASPSTVEEPHMVNLLPRIWEVDRSAFITFWKHNQIIAFYGKVPLHDKMLQVLGSESLLQPFLRVWSFIPNAYLLSFIGIDPELEGKTRAYIINALINHFARSEWILDFTCLKEWFPVFELLGFERAQWADAVTAAGTEYQAFVLDLRQEDFLTKLDRSVSRHPAEEASEPSESSNNVLELKRVLKHWSLLPRKSSLSQDYARLFSHRMKAGESDSKLGLSVQKDLEHAIRKLMEGNEREEMLGKLLHYTYIEGIRPHDRVAKKLNVSMATYYRHLNQALELLCQALTFGGP